MPTARRRDLLLLALALEVAALTTPAVEWAARLLLVEPRLGPADAIVVLGSGVLPGGRPTPWAEERVRHGVHLFRRGLAPRIILSGGRTSPQPLAPLNLLEWWATGNHAQLEAESYAVFAQEALRVPRQALVLEDLSHTTWENGLYTARLLRRHGWRRVLLVTSPTHMRRGLGVFRALDVEAAPAPVPDSHLYSPAPGDRFRAWRALCHELIGLPYYLLRGRASLLQY